mmetsp:Transcript_38821/g.123383  ORF Transcript_38821/g.123383 Transcript_38821/m.123383 type:complete len:269 (+) Transcript_38821:505-1311(+)
MRADGPVDLGHLSAGPREEARARVGNGRAAPSAELDGGGGARGERHRVHVELPVPGLGDGCPRVLADEVCGVHAADDHLAPGGGPGLAVQPEGEDWRVHQPLLEEVVKGRDDPVHRDGLEAEAEDAVKLCRNESKPGLLGCLGEDLVLHLQVPQRESVLGEEPRQGAAAVLDRELLAVSHVGGRLGCIELAVEVTRHLEVAALAGRDPEVGGSGVEHDLERLGGCPDADLPVVLHRRTVSAAEGPSLKGPRRSVGTAVRGSPGRPCNW